MRRNVVLSCGHVLCLLQAGDLEAYRWRCEWPSLELLLSSSEADVVIGKGAEGGMRDRESG
ncbi:hypothetical protein M758_11G135600 [Ceratodon purpureus]|nr:hypothetical protein M758_11G135600 [Ceratodon purpureus]